tara:strand:- start:245 stop:1084 length:840 start_codon:yes stop_codon:yes gene_type:complete
MKVGYTMAFHHSAAIRPNGKKVLKRNLKNFYNSCEYNFETFIIDNESIPRNIFDDVIELESDKYKNLSHTYIENQNKKGITGAWDLGVRQAIGANCDIIILTTDDTICDKTINNLIEFIWNDKEFNHITLYAPAVNGPTVPPIQQRNKPENNTWLVDKPSEATNNYLSGNMYAFTKEFYYNFNENNVLFKIDHQFNGGDGKWGGQEGLQFEWASRGARIMVVGSCLIQHSDDIENGTRLSYRTARYIDNGEIDRVIQHFTKVDDVERVKGLQELKNRKI